MKDVSFETRKMYFQALQPLGIPIFDTVAPTGANAPYIIIGDISETDQSTKSDYSNKIRINIEVLTQYPTANNKGRKESEMIMQQIQGVIFPQLPIISETIQLLSTQKESSRSLIDYTDTSIIIRKITIFSHLVKEK